MNETAKPFASGLKLPGRGAGQPAHVIVVGNEKGGAGKSTVAMHLVVALMRMGRVVGAIDLRQRHSLVDVVAEHAPLVMQKLGGIRIKGEVLDVKIATAEE